MGKPNKVREGFSLIEMIIAMAIVGFVMSGVILLMSYSTNTMRRTSNMVNLQNQVKDALLHITTYLQEGNDFWWDDTNKELYIAGGEKDNLGNVSKDRVVISRYVFKPEPADPEATTTPEGETPEPTRGAIYFNKLTVPSDVVEDDHLLSEGKVNFSEPAVFSKIKSLFTSAVGTGESESSLFVKNVIGFNCEVVTNQLPPTTDPVGNTVQGDVIGSKCIKVELGMKNKSGDAEFSSTKEVYLRNS
ncbi:MAG: type II secretion system protein [Eubacterium sp.]|nr:type II secretion system protein [Eubacterium sp.]